MVNKYASFYYMGGNSLTFRTLSYMYPYSLCFVEYSKGGKSIKRYIKVGYFDNVGIIKYRCKYQLPIWVNEKLKREFNITAHQLV